MGSDLWGWICGAHFDLWGQIYGVGSVGLTDICGVGSMGSDLWGAPCSLLSCASVYGVHAVRTWGAELWGLWGTAVGSVG